MLLVKVNSGCVRHLMGLCLEVTLPVQAKANGMELESEPAEHIIIIIII